MFEELSNLGSFDEIYRTALMVKTGISAVVKCS